MIERWDRERQAAPSDTRIILTHTNDEVRALNEAARERLRDAGELGEDVAITAERGERQFASGDRIMFLRNERELGVKNGTLGTVEEVTPQRMSVRVVRPLETVAQQGAPLPWLAIVGGGFVDLLKGEPARVTGDVRPGDFIFPVVALRELAVPTSVRGGPAGALILAGERSLAGELFGGSPPLIDILGE